MKPQVVIDKNSPTGRAIRLVVTGICAVLLFTQSLGADAPAALTGAVGVLNALLVVFTWLTPLGDTTTTDTSE
jgi:hypothetical protein